MGRAFQLVRVTDLRPGGRWIVIAEPLALFALWPTCICSAALATAAARWLAPLKVWTVALTTIALPLALLLSVATFEILPVSGNNSDEVRMFKIGYRSSRLRYCCRFRYVSGGNGRRQHEGNVAVKERNLGKSGLRVTTIGLGCNNFGGRIDLEASRRVVHKALDLGIAFLDVADVYGGLGGGHLGASEECLGQILGDRRKDIVLATKFGIPMSETLKGTSRRYIMTAVEASLRRLKTDWIDLYQVHRPDPETPIEETLRALDDLVRQGKVRYLGCSNFAAWQVVDAQWTARHCGLNRFISCQDEYSLVVRDIERELLPAIRAHDLGLLPYFPLASGLLTGKYKRNRMMPAGGRLTETPRLADRYLTEDHWQKVERLEAFCAARGRSLLELAFSWLLARPAVVSVIAGATRPEQLEANVKAGDWALSVEDLAEIDRLAA